jgi:hypothetical protein
MNWSAVSAVAVGAALIGTLLGCAEQQRSLSGSSAQYLNVEGKRIMVRVSPMPDQPGEYRLIAVRDAMVIDPDRDKERERGAYAARYYMKQTCQERGFTVLEEGMLDNINYFTRFRCGG